MRGAEDAGEAQQRRVGSLVAEFEHTSGSEHPRLSIHAQFIDARGVPVERAFEALDVWSSDAELDRDACSMPLPERPTPRSMREDIRLDLLSVGPITVDGPRRDLELQGRHLPPLVEAFSGVVYGTSDRRDSSVDGELAYVPGAGYTFEAPGDRGAGGFEVTLPAPPRVRLTAVSGRAGGERDEVRLRRGRDLSVRWNEIDGGRSEVFFDIEAGGGPEAPRLKCRLEDDGRFTIPGGLLTELADDSSRLRLAIRRVESKQVDVSDIEEADFYLSTADHLTLRLE